MSMPDHELSRARPGCAARALQGCLDAFFYARKHIVASIAFIAFRAYALEVEYKHVLQGYYPSRVWKDLDLANAKDLDGLLKLAEGSFDEAECRRGTLPTNARPS